MGTSVVSIGSSGSVTTGSVVGGGAVVLVMGAEMDVVESTGSSGSVMVVFWGGWVVTEPDVDAAVVTGLEDALPLDAESLGTVVTGAELSSELPSLPSHVGGAPGEVGMLEMSDPAGTKVEALSRTEVEVLSRTTLGGELESDGSGSSSAVGAVEGAGLGEAGGCVPVGAFSGGASSTAGSSKDSRSATSLSEVVVGSGSVATVVNPPTVANDPRPAGPNSIWSRTSIA